MNHSGRSRALFAITGICCLLGCTSSPASEDEVDVEQSKLTCSVVEPSIRDQELVDSQAFVGLSLSDAEALAAEQGLSVRVLGIDGDCRPRDDNFIADRINLYIEDDRVAAAQNY